MIKALNIMQNTVSVKDRASDYLQSIKRNIQRDEIDTLIIQREKLEDKIRLVQDFTLLTDLNAGQAAINREECEKRFKQALAMEYDLEILNLEIESKQAIFANYFEDAATV